MRRRSKRCARPPACFHLSTGLQSPRWSTAQRRYAPPSTNSPRFAFTLPWRSVTSAKRRATSSRDTSSSRRPRQPFNHTSALRRYSCNEASATFLVPSHASTASPTRGNPRAAARSREGSRPSRARPSSACACLRAAPGESPGYRPRVSLRFGSVRRPSPVRYCTKKLFAPPGETRTPKPVTRSSQMA